MGRVHLDHWWVSHSERLALNSLRTALRAEGIELVDGSAAADVHTCLMSAQRVWEGVCGCGLRPIDVAPYLMPFDFESRIFTPFRAVDSPSRLSLFGIPIGAFRNNTLWVNRAIADALGPQPQNAADWLAWLGEATRFVPYPLAVGQEDWQMSMLLETVVLALHGADFQRRAFGLGLHAALASAKMRQALEYVKKLAPFLTPCREAATWDTAAADCQSGRCAAIVMGDWAHNEFAGAASDRPSSDYEAVYKWTVPGTEASFLYSVDYITPVEQPGESVDEAVLATLTRTLLRPDVQCEFGLIKGALPAVRDAAAATIDPSSWKMFHLATLCPEILVPSMSHLQGAPRQMRDLVSAVVRHLVYEGGTVSQAQASLTKRSAEAGPQWVAGPQILRALEEHGRSV